MLMAATMTTVAIHATVSRRMAGRRGTVILEGMVFI
jgi:hypothetical protein